ncbi:ARM repeat superfamily protein [Sesbania bispinosa]|nr:ARM repeat superfamily protein [Sesbania bispinosa]
MKRIMSPGNYWFLFFMPKFCKDNDTKLGGNRHRILSILEALDFNRSHEVREAIAFNLLNMAKFEADVEMQKEEPLEDLKLFMKELQQEEDST